MTPAELREASLLTAGAISQRVARAERDQLTELLRRLLDGLTTRLDADPRPNQVGDL
ncbi:hypothetical protein AB0L25_02155 [Spirillospora sp. NPDC052242]